MTPRWILASDIDNTLTGDPAALRSLAERLQAARDAGELFLVLSTGRRLDQVLDGIEREGLPPPDAVISQVGTEIYLPPLGRGAQPLATWNALLQAQFSAVIARSLLHDIAGLEMQPQLFNTPLKVSCFLDRTPDPEAAAEAIAARVREHPQGANYQVVWSSGRDLDILPAAAGKGRAIRFLLQTLGLDQERVIVAGDSGNDRAMFDEFARGIVVANAQPELRRLAEEEPGPGLYLAQQPYAAGVHEGLRHFGCLND